MSPIVAVYVRILFGGAVAVPHLFPFPFALLQPSMASILRKSKSTLKNKPGSTPWSCVSSAANVHPSLLDLLVSPSSTWQGAGIHSGAYQDRRQPIAIGPRPEGIQSRRKPYEKSANKDGIFNGSASTVEWSRETLTGGYDGIPVLLALVGSLELGQDPGRSWLC